MKTRKGLFRPAAAIAILAFSSGAAAAEGALTVVSFGGSYQEAQRRAFFDPFTAETGTEILEDSWRAEVAKISTMVDSGNVIWDVVDGETNHVLAGCEEGWLEPIDYDVIGDTSAFLPGTTHECGVGTIFFSQSASYNADAFAGGEAPQTIADFFDVEKFPNPRSMRKHPKHTLEFALFADGVPADQVYEVLGTEEGLARAFAKLDTIKPFVKVWWDSSSTALELLANGEVDMLTVWASRIFVAQTKGQENLQVIWDGHVMDIDWWIVPKGTPNKDKAMEFIAFASDPQRMAEQSSVIAYAPVRTDALATIPPELMHMVNVSPENYDKGLRLDAQFWMENEEQLMTRFLNWLAQ